jgi:hypothetical protein
MATNILLNQTMAAGVVHSSEISNVTNLDVQAILSEGATGKVNYTIERKTENGSFRTAKDENGFPLQFSTVDDIQDGINIAGLNAYAVRVRVDKLGGTGTLSLEYESL